jgi:xylulokinase
VSARGAALGFDVGTTSVKAGLLWLDEQGPMEVASRGYRSTRSRPGWVEQDPSDWLEAMASCWAELARRVGPVELRSVGICSQVNTHVFVDEALRPTYPAITWQDIRAAPEAADLDALAAPRREQLWGGPFTVDASFALSRAAWLQRHEPKPWRLTRWILSPKDFCVAALTGEVVTDPISPVGLVGTDGSYLDGVLDLVQGSARRLPPLRDFDAPAGIVAEGASLGLPAGVSVAVGTMDAWGSVYGSGLVRAGTAMEVSGTSEVVAVLSDRVLPTPGIISFAPVRGRHLHAGPTQAGGASLEWAARVLGRSVEEVLALAAEGRLDPQSLVFLPHLAGERAPHWNPAARGVLIGLTSSTDERHVALAVLEGVAFSARLLLGECEAAAGLRAHEVRLSGGGARSRLWNQVKATAHGRPLHVLETVDSGVLGATLMGMVAAGIEPDLDALADRRASVADRVDPEPEERHRMDDLYEVYLATYEALIPVFPSVAGSRHGGSAKVGAREVGSSAVGRRI